MTEQQWHEILIVSIQPLMILFGFGLGVLIAALIVNRKK